MVLTILVEVSSFWYPKEYPGFQIPKIMIGDRRAGWGVRVVRESPVLSQIRHLSTFCYLLKLISRLTDADRPETLQASASAGLTNSSDGNLHMVAVVVNQTSVSFFTDAVLTAEVPLAQPVTDCINTRMRVGQATTVIPQLGEITFFPRPISAVEMKEIMATGFTYQAIAAGKRPHVADQNSNLDDFKVLQDEQLVAAKVEREEAAFALNVQQVITRAQLKQAGTEISYPELSIEKTPNCRPVGAFGSPPCNIVQDIGDILTQDLHNPGREYYELFTPQMRGGRDPQQLFSTRTEYESEQLNYNASKFPSW